jgi:asparagine synthase (glutamine-hydrolysing)
MGALIAVVDKKGGDATQPAITMLSTLSSSGTEAFGIASSSNVKTVSRINALRKLDLNSPVVIGHRFSRILRSDSPQPILLKGVAIVLEGRVYFPEDDPQLEPLASSLRESGRQAARAFIEKSSGDYAFALAKSRRLIAGRDAVGARPLYYGENTMFAALASERKALWRIGIETTYSFPPGHVALADEKGFKFERVKTLTYSKPKPTSIQAAAKELETLLRNSTMQRVTALKEVAVAFSGGLDSSIIALLVRELGLDVQLIHVSLENQTETQHARNAAELLGLPIQVRLFKEEDVEEAVPKVLCLIEEADPLKTSIGIPVYWTAQQAARMGFKVMLAGQGADELFGGYRRYVDDYVWHGEGRVRKRIFNDIVEIHETNLERDFKICNFHNVELRLPFAAFEIAKFAIGLPVKLKIDPHPESLRKLVLRKVAERIGLPERIVKKPKKALQYTTGVDRALKRLARGQSVTVKDYLQKTFHKTLEETI